MTKELNEIVLKISCLPKRDQSWILNNLSESKRRFDETHKINKLLNCTNINRLKASTKQALLAQWEREKNHG
jgi:hypothetical protein